MPEQYLQVAVPVPIRQLFTYLVPEEMQSPSIEIGERVAVSFGARKVIAIVIAITDKCTLDTKIKPISKRLNDSFHLSNSLVSFLNLCANYYHHPIGDVFQQALPKLLRQVKNIELQPPMTWHSVDIVKNEVKECLTKVESKAPKQFALYQLISNHHGISWAELRTLGYSKAQLNALTSKNLIVEAKQKPNKFSWQQTNLTAENKKILSKEQAIIVAAISQSLKQFYCHLIDGITGSGKTEVYLQAMENVLANNQQVLVIVPEIGLTPQTLLRFEQRFNVPICLHHSNLNDTERLDTWLSAQQGSAALSLIHI